MTTSVTPAAIGDAWMSAMVASLADNKAILGRRYSDWSVSAPTLESAVAAAAMAQDELGHARSTYPVLKALGSEVEESEGFGGVCHFALLDREFADWLDFVVANLVVDGMLTTFVGACDGSSVTQLAQRARKILQEEGSHRVHGEAWARRLMKDDEQATLLAGRVADAWVEVSHWLGPEGDEGARAALDLGMVSVDVASQRELVRTWLVGLFEAGDVDLVLGDPVCWDGWVDERRRLER